MTTYAYLRISTDRQDAASQRAQISQWCETTNQSVAEYVEDIASGGTPWQKRQLAPLLHRLSHGDTIIVSEVSRIARSTIGVLSFLQDAAARGVTVIAARDRLVMDESLHSKITVTVLALAADIERNLLRERTRAALDARRQAGLPLGRPKGSRSGSMLDSRGPEIFKCLKANVSKRAIARLMGCAPGTLYAFLSESGVQLSAEDAADMARQDATVDIASQHDSVAS